MDTKLLWPLAYHLSGVTLLARTDAEPLGSLPLPIRTAVLKTVADTDPRYLNLDLAQKILDFSEGHYEWVSHWSYRDTTRRYRHVSEYYQDHHLEAPATTAVRDEHFAERQFIEQVFLPVFGLHGLDLLHPQVRFEDDQGTPRFIDFVLQGAQRYAIEIEGETYHHHAPDSEKFRNEKQRQRSLVRAGYHYYPFAFVDLEEGEAHKGLVQLARSDPVLSQLIDRRKAQGEIPAHLSALLVQLRDDFQPIQCAILHLLQQAVQQKRTQLTWVTDRPDAATFALAVLDTLALIERVATLYGLPISLPQVDLYLVAPVHAINVTTLLSHYLGGDPAKDKRVDRAATPIVLHWVSGLPITADLIVTDDSSVREQFSAARTITELKQLSRDVAEAFNTPLGEVLPVNPGREVLDYFARRFFPVPELKSEQVGLIARALHGESGLGILPTGFGKSLVFQLTALLLPRPSLVISPLTALIRDQVFNLRRIGIGAVESLTSALSRNDKDRVLEEFCNGRYRLLYISPERMQNHTFFTKLQQAVQQHPLGALIIDEAHCVSEWGHEFRPAYLQIARRRRQLEQSSQQLPLIALTATASTLVRNDLLNILELPASSVVQLVSSDRPTLSLSAHRVSDPAQKPVELGRILQEHIPTALGTLPAELLPVEQHAPYQHAGVIFGMYAAPTSPLYAPEGVHFIAAAVRQQTGLREEEVRAYASGAPDLCPRCRAPQMTRDKNQMTCKSCGGRFAADTVRTAKDFSQQMERYQDAFQQSQFPVLVATKGYGMGIDKRNIRFIVHHALSGGLEGYYQEAGRAGRDGAHAHVALMYTPPHPECHAQYVETLQAPPCTEKNGKCPYFALPCDYGRQAQMIHRSYPGIDADRKHALDVWGGLQHSTIISGSNGSNEEARKGQELALYRLQLLGLVETYTLQYQGLNDVRFHVTRSPEHTVAHVRMHLEQFVAKLDTTGTTTRTEFNTLPQRESDAPVDEEYVRAAICIVLTIIYTRVVRMRYDMLRNQLNYAESTAAANAPEQRCRRVMIHDVFDPDLGIAPDYRCGFCDVCVPDLHFQRESALPPVANEEIGEIVKLFNSQLDHWRPEVLDEAVRLAEQHQIVAGLFTRATYRLEQDPGNLTALFFAGALGRRRAGRERQALEYLHFGFTESRHRTLPTSDLLRFYREAVAIDAEAAFVWLTEAGGPWDADAEIPFLLVEAHTHLGVHSPHYRRLRALYRTRRMYTLSVDSQAIAEYLERLEGSFIQPA